MYVIWQRNNRILGDRLNSRPKGWLYEVIKTISSLGYTYETEELSSLTMWKNKACKRVDQTGNNKLQKKMGD